MSHAFQGHHIPGSVYHTHHTLPEILPHHCQHGLFHGHARTIKTSAGSRTLCEHQTAGPAGGPTEKHLHPRQLNPQDKDRHPAHCDHVTHELNANCQPKPPKPGCPFHDSDPTDAPRYAHANHHHTHPGSTNGYEQHENSPIYHGNYVIQPGAGHYTIPPAPTRQNQHHYHHAHDPAPVEPQVHQLYQHMYFAHGALDPETPRHEPEENPPPKESPRDRNKPRLRIHEEDLLWGYGPPLPMLTMHRRKNNQRGRKI